MCLKIWCSQIQYHHFSHSEKQQFVEYTIIYHIFRSTPIYLCFSEIFSSCVKLCSHFVPVLPPGLLEVPATLYNQRHPEASATAVIFPQCLGCHGSPPLGLFLNWGIPPCHHRFQSENSLMTWMIWVYPRFGQPPNMST